MLRYAVLPATTMLDLFYAYKGRTIEHYLLFTGYPRAGSSILGYLLDAHPDMAVSHEAEVLERSLRGWIYSAKRGHIIRSILTTKERFSPKVEVKDQWLRQYRCLRVIGDKRVSIPTEILYEHPSFLESLHSTMGLPLRVLFTCRNPYDMVAARNLRHLQKAKLTPRLRYLLDYEPVDNEKFGLGLSPGRMHPLDWLLQHTDKLTKVLSMFSEDEVFFVRHEDLIASPKDKLRDICTFLGVECTEDYLDSCAAVVYTSPHKTRFKVRWTTEEIERVAAAIEKYPWFEGYTFDD